MQKTPFLKRAHRWLPVVLALALVLSYALAPVSAIAAETGQDEGAPPVADEETEAAATNAWNAGEHEVAAYYMADYGGSGNLPNSKSNVTGFYNTLRYHPWTIFGYPRWCNFSGHQCYMFGDAAAWEDDWVDNNNSYIDRVDVVFYEGHGWPGGFTLRPPDDHYVQYGEVQHQWGNSDLEWMFLLSCSVLDSSHLTDWYHTFNGLHGIAGFGNTAYDVNGFGSTLATHIVFGKRYRDAWFTTCDQKQPGGVQARVLMEDSIFYYESAYNQYSDRPHDGYYYWWYKWCGAPTEGHVSPAQLNNTFPVYQTPALSLDEATRELGELADTFGVAGEPQAADTFSLASSHVITVGNSWIISDTTTGHQLEMDYSTGQFYYYDPEQTFGNPALESASAQAVLTEEDAKRIADQFLQENGLMPADAQYTMVDSIIQAEAQVPEGPGAAGVAEVSQTTTGYQVIYNRYLPVTTVDAAGVAQTTQIPVDGPGAKIKVYVDPASNGEVAVAGANQEPGAVVGAMGGWRQVGQNERAQAQAYPLLDYETQVKAIFEHDELRPLASYEDVPFKTTQTNIISFTVAGWEESNGESQDMIYPAYRIDATYEGEQNTNGVTETVVLTGSTWIAGNPEFMRPLARIETAPPADQNFGIGDTIQATAVDASQTLADLGYGANLDFALGDADLYLYEWFLGDPETGKPIGDGTRNLTYTLVREDLEDAKQNITPVTITLVVTNGETSHTSVNSSSTSFQIQAASPVYLPNLTK